MRSHTALIDAIAEITDNQGHTDKHEQRPRRLELEVMLSPIRNGLITAEVRLIDGDPGRLTIREVILLIHVRLNFLKLPPLNDISTVTPVIMDMAVTEFAHMRIDQHRALRDRMNLMPRMPHRFQGAGIFRNFRTLRAHTKERLRFIDHDNGVGRKLEPLLRIVELDPFRLDRRMIRLELTNIVIVDRPPLFRGFIVDLFNCIESLTITLQTGAENKHG